MNGAKSILKFYKKSFIPSANIFIRSALIHQKSAIDQTISVRLRFPTTHNFSTSTINGVIIRYCHGSQNATTDSHRVSKDKENAIAVNFDSEEEINNFEKCLKEKKFENLPKKFGFFSHKF